MERKRELCGVQKRNPIKRSRKKLLKKLVDYLISDSYMFAPLISSPPKMFRSSPPPIREPIRETKKKKLFKNIGEYLKSDSYMYAPLLQSTSPLPTGTFRIPLHIIPLYDMPLQLYEFYWVLADNSENKARARIIRGA
ncbi:hypothetical protein CIPAW_08G040600 [Carya illinoinensis]|uniref:Uncharacterized protein n=1 Tax=Carya illinoinensis TaxID=32201 RepID=A0A8T1PQU9_CARIL|nr:hypothetical protein CIPAW_08G040600 [Carya illinoinensis]